MMKRILVLLASLALALAVSLGVSAHPLGDPTPPADPNSTLDETNSDGADVEPDAVEQDAAEQDAADEDADDEDADDEDADDEDADDAMDESQAPSLNGTNAQSGANAKGNDVTSAGQQSEQDSEQDGENEGDDD